MDELDWLMGKLKPETPMFRGYKKHGLRLRFSLKPIQ